MTKPATDEEIESLERALTERDISTAYSDHVLSLIARIKAEHEARKQAENDADTFCDALAKTGWQPIETAPKDIENLLVWDGKEPILVNWVPRMNAWCVLYDYDCEWQRKPTHWMPLLAPRRDP